MKSYLEFLEYRKKFVINESFNAKDFDKVTSLITKVLKKNCVRKLMEMPGFVQNRIDGKLVQSKQYVIAGGGKANDRVVQFNWLNDTESRDVYSVDFFEDETILWTGKAKTVLSLYTLGQSIVYFLPIIWTVINSGKYDITQKDAIDAGRKVFNSKSLKESLMHIGDIEYTVLENVSDDVIYDTFILNERKTGNKEFDEIRTKLRATALQRQHSSDKELKKTAGGLFKLISEINAEIALNDVSSLDELPENLKVAIKNAINVVSVKTPEEKKYDEEVKAEKHEDPQIVFKKMIQYVKLVINGINPSVILCGAPGVGKTYRVRKLLAASNYREGHNLMTIKGKMTPRRLYLSLYEMKEKGKILLIDDADSLVGPKAPEDAINILKGALDSTTDDEGGRIVTYGVSGKLVDDEGVDIPKRMSYKGGVIIITNYNAGQLDSALKGRSFIQDIKFSVDDVLNLIGRMLPSLGDDTMSMSAKEKSLAYIKELAEKGENVEISFRTFLICAKLYQAAEKDDDFTDEEVESMIAEQMKLQAARGGNKY
jgi:hypothetical protein